MPTTAGTVIQNVELFTQSASFSAGEEITISDDKGGPCDSRRTHLKDAFGFDWNCSLSIAPIGNSGRVMSRPEESLADCHSLLQVLEEEYSKDSTF